MKILLDTAVLSEIRWAHSAGLADGVTTDPSLLSGAAAGGDPRELLREICAATPGPVMAGVVAVDSSGMYREARDLARIADNLVVSLPALEEGFAVARRLSAEGVAVNVTLVFSAMQALLGAKTGAAYVSACVGPLDEAGHDGIELVAQVRRIVDLHELETEVVAASLRGPLHAARAALAGADAASLPPEALRQSLLHPLTDRGVDRYLRDWSAGARTPRTEGAS